MIKRYFDHAFRFSPIASSYVRRSFSQFGEDRIVHELLGGKRNGFFVEVGAWHPFNFSNTRLFAEMGWKGLLIEPQPAAARNLRRFRKEATVVNCAVGETETTALFRCAATCSKLVDRSAASENDPSTIKVQVRRLQSILADIPSIACIVFLSVDCEGHDLSVLRSNDWQKYRPIIVAVEDHVAETQSEIHEFLSAQGYRFCGWAGLTKIFKAGR